MFFMHADPLQGVGGWALEIETILGPVKWHRADRRVPFGTQKSRDFQGPKLWALEAPVETGESYASINLKGPAMRYLAPGFFYSPSLYW
jgi:hypothetical protein